MMKLALGRMEIGLDRMEMGLGRPGGDEG